MPTAIYEQQDKIRALEDELEIRRTLRTLAIARDFIRGMSSREIHSKYNVSMQTALNVSNKTRNLLNKLMKQHITPLTAYERALTLGVTFHYSCAEDCDTPSTPGIKLDYVSTMSVTAELKDTEQ